jgi:hypothetical protein
MENVIDHMMAWGENTADQFTLSVLLSRKLWHKNYRFRNQTRSRVDIRISEK